MASSQDIIQLTERFGTHNYHPLDVVIAEAKGVWVKDVEGKKYLDMLAAYSALNFGHQNDRFIKVAKAQLDKLTMTSRAFYNDQLGGLCEELARFCGLDMVLPMNSGAEAVESGIKIARRWGYDRKKIPENQAEIICFTNNFHGRTTTIVSFYTSESGRRGFGPFTPGFVLVPFGDIAALERAMTPRTTAVLVEPIQGEGGVLIPPAGFLRDVRALCDRQNVLFIADEIQTGLCRTGRRFCVEHEGVVPDMFLLGKSLGGGITPISAVVGKREVMEVLTPGSHGSTFGGNPFACAIAREVLRYIADEKPEQRATELGGYLVEQLRAIKTSRIQAIRGKGLFVGVDIAPSHGKAWDYCEKLKAEGILCKDTREQTIRFAPPLVIERSDIDWALERIRKVLG